MRTLLPVALLSLLSPWLTAQDEKQIESDQAFRRRIDERIQNMRNAIGKGLPITTNVRVTVWLRNKHKLKGVVKNGRFVERATGLDFVAADQQTKGAGIRVWYYDDTNSFIFLPFESIARYKIGVRLTQVQVDKIEEQIEQRRQAAEARRQKMAEARKTPEEQGDDKGDDKGDPDADELAREEARLLALVDEFPPADGWSQDKVEEIERRKIVLGVFPDEKQRRFLEVFEDWKRGLALKEHNDELARKKAEEETEKAKQATEGAK